MAGAEWVINPTDIISTPVLHISSRFSRLMFPEASTEQELPSFPL